MLLDRKKQTGMNKYCSNREYSVVAGGLLIVQIYIYNFHSFLKIEIRIIFDGENLPRIAAKMATSAIEGLLVLSRNQFRRYLFQRASNSSKKNAGITLIFKKHHETTHICTHTIYKKKTIGE